MHFSTSAKGSTLSGSLSIQDSLQTTVNNNLLWTGGLMQHRSCGLDICTTSVNAILAVWRGAAHDNLPE